ncbi:MAG: glycosyltransferase [Sphingobacteriales bacterium]|nr:MAG: glycosyltransferase [Sphingobacteriales bacterium]
MRVLQIINSLETGGAEKLILDTIPHYVRAGIKMDLLLLWDDQQPFAEALRALDCCNIFVLKASVNKKDIYSPKQIFKIRKFLKNYDIAHVHLFPAQYFAVFAKMISGAKTSLVFTEHNTTNRRINNKFLKPVDRFIYSKYQNLVCITQEIYDIYAAYLGSNNKLTLINNGVDLSIIKRAIPYSKRELLPQLADEDKIILQVAAFRPQKDQATLIKALQKLPDSFKLLLVGVGECLNECQELTTALNLQDRVFFLGQRMDVPRLLKSADYVVLSSHYEGLSLSSIEGLASGSPFLASRVPGLKEIVAGAGILFEAGNDTELAAQLLQLENNPQHYNDVVLKCCSRAEEYDIDQMIKKHITLYRNLVV